MWTDTAPVSDYYHNNGGLLVVASDIDAARKAAATHMADVHVRGFVDEERRGERHAKMVAALADAKWQTSEPNRTFPVADGVTPGVIVFPNGGCCG